MVEVVGVMVSGRDSGGGSSSGASSSSSNNSSSSSSSSTQNDVPSVFKTCNIYDYAIDFRIDSVENGGNDKEKLYLMPKNGRILWRMRKTAPKRIFPVLRFVFYQTHF